MKPKLDIYLLKSADESSKDKYVEFLGNEQNRSFEINEINLINLLEFKFVNLDEFESKINLFLNSAMSYSCLIITSRQVVEAMKRIHLSFDFLNNEQQLAKKCRIYCVGEQTRDAFKSFIVTCCPNAMQCFDIRLPSKQIGSELAELIVNENLPKNEAFKAFFPCSAIRKDDLILKLNDSHLKVEELTLYETTASKNGTQRLTDLIELKSKDESTCVVNCFVLFSPSCVQAVFNDIKLREILFDVFERNGNYSYFVSVGASTNAALIKCHKELGKLYNAVEMEDPSPRGLVKSLEAIYSRF